MTKETKERQPGQPYTIAEVASILRVGYGTVNKLCKTGQLKSRRIGEGRGLWRIDESALDDYIEGAMYVPEPEPEAEKEEVPVADKRPKMHYRHLVG